MTLCRLLAVLSDYGAHYAGLFFFFLTNSIVFAMKALNRLTRWHFVITIPTSWF